MGTSYRTRGPRKRALYPVVDRVLGASGATVTMSRDHVEVVRLVGELAERRDALAAGDAGPDAIRAVQRLLYGLYAVLRLHFAKEEEVYLPLLDAALTAAEAGAMFTEMDVAAHAAAHRARGGTTMAARRDEDERSLRLDAPPPDRDRDGTRALHDVEAEAGDEDGLDDLFVVDRAEARALGVDLDSLDGQEPQLT